MKIYNSLSKKVETFKPQNPAQISMYLCGPTVYDYVHIGNFRTYTLGDFVYRILKFNGYNVRYIMNLTDVGHLTGDNLGNPDFGNDRLELAAAREKKSAQDVAEFYIQDFTSNFDKLNLIRPEKFTKATDYIQEQIDLIKILEEKGYTYVISDGVYFDTAKYKKYGVLSGLNAEAMKEGARVEPNPEKINPTDFSLWRFSEKGSTRWQEWDSPWGKGFPGWHVECSAMSMSELGPTLDLHLGGEDLKMIHHTNEIAQSECATDKPFVKYWMHGAFLQVDGGRMGKSLGNAFTLHDVESKGFDPLSMRYFYMMAHYRSTLNFTWDALQSSHNALRKMYDLFSSYRPNQEEELLDDESMDKFVTALNDDINMPKAVSIAWEVLKSELPESVKASTLLKFDEVLGLNLKDYMAVDVPQRVLDMARTRMEYRNAGIWDKADMLRRQIEELGFAVEDVDRKNFRVKRKI